MDSTLLKIEDENRWNELLLNAINASYRAGMKYEYYRREEYQKPDTFIFSEQGIDIAGAHYLLKSGFNGLIKIGDIKSGLIITDGFKPENVKDLIEHFISWGEEKYVSYLRFDPWLQATINGRRSEYNSVLNDILDNFGFQVINKGRCTYWIDLSYSEDELLSRMRRKTRYDIRRGMNSGIKIKEIRYPDESLINKFWYLYSQLGNKKQFKILPEFRFKNEIRILLNSGFASLFIAKFMEEIINISMVSTIGIASYMYGALNPEYGNFKDCPPPGHFVQWSMIKRMKENGIKTYDLGFSPGHIPSQEHPEYNIWHFKYGFGGDFVQFMPTYGKILKPLRGKAFQFLRQEKN